MYFNYEYLTVTFLPSTNEEFMGRQHPPHRVDTPPHQADKFISINVSGYCIPNLINMHERP